MGLATGGKIVQQGLAELWPSVAAILEQIEEEAAHHAEVRPVDDAAAITLR